MSFQDFERQALKREATDKLGGITKTLRATKTWDPASMALFAVGALTTMQASTTIAVPGAAPGDCVGFGFSTVIPAGVVAQAAVTANDVVTVSLTNLTNAAVDLASGTLKVVVFK